MFSSTRPSVAIAKPIVDPMTESKEDLEKKLMDIRLEEQEAARGEESLLRRTMSDQTAIRSKGE